MSSNITFDLILFDLGGVLIEYGGLARMTEWTAGRLSAKELARWWRTSDAVTRFEKGMMSPGQFAEIIVKELALPVTPQEFLDEAHGWFKGPFPGSIQLLQDLSCSFTLATLCNTNGLYWPRFEATDLHRFFTFHFPSHLTGLMKPDARAYTHVLDQTGIAPDRIVFLDDTLINVEQARSAGLHAYRTVGVHEARTRLNLLGLLPPRPRGSQDRPP